MRRRLRPTLSKARCGDLFPFETSLIQIAHLAFTICGGEPSTHLLRCDGSTVPSKDEPSKGSDIPKANHTSLNEFDRAGRGLDRCRPIRNDPRIECEAEESKGKAGTCL
jgi:hypothetical protein